MMNLLQRSLGRNDASASANATNPSATKPTKAVTGTGVMGGLHNSGPLFSGADHSFYKNNYDYHYAGSYYPTSIPNSANLPFHNFEAGGGGGGERFLNQGQNESTCQKKHIHHTHHTHSNNQSQRSSAMSNYFDNFASYGKLFPPSALQYLHQHNHLEEILIAQQLFAKLDWIDDQPVTLNYYNNKYQDKFSDNFKNNKQLKQLKAHEYEALTKYAYSDKKDDLIDSYTVPIFMNGKFGSILATHCPLNYEKNILGYSSSSNDFYRISFLETNIYQAQDMPSSPQHLPHQRGYSQSFLHNEWIKSNLDTLRNCFKTTYNNEILVNVEKKAKFPFIVFGNSNNPKFQASSNLIMPTATSVNLSHELRITDVKINYRNDLIKIYQYFNTFDLLPNIGLFEICDYVLSQESLIENYESLQGATKKQPLGYIISTYQTFPGEDNEKLEESWFVWTGAAYLSRTLPSTIGLGRLLFFKRRDLHLLKSDCLKQFVDNELPIFTYVLLCELFNLKEAHLPSTCAIIDQLRARACGYTALYINCT